MCFVLVLAACGGGGGDGDDGSPSPDSMMDTALTCKSVALCTTYDVKTFVGTVPAPAGGSVENGVYRLAYDLIPDDVGEQEAYRDELEVLQIRDGHFNWAAFFHDELGTYTTSGQTITFQETRRCDRGAEGEASTARTEYAYTATGDELHLYSRVMRSDGVSWDKMYVYKRTTSPDDVCRTVNAEPSAPGDSARCNVTNCACSFAVEGTVDACI